MRPRCGETFADHIVIHVLPMIDGRTVDEGRTWRGDCPACRTGRTLVISARGRTVADLYRCHARECEYKTIIAALVLLLPGCYGRPRQKRVTIDPDALTDLALTPMPPQSLRLALLEMAGIGTSEALDMLGVPRQSRPRVISSRRDSATKPQAG